jgi:BMFP domain-containing protein YqiC
MPTPRNKRHPENIAPEQAGFRPASSGAAHYEGQFFITLELSSMNRVQAMANRADWFEDFQKNVSELIAKSPAADIERNVKAMMAQTFSRLDLITREEFDTQAELLERALARIAVLEVKVRELETTVSTGGAATE